MEILWFILGVMVTIGAVILCGTLYSVGVKEGEKHAKRGGANGCIVSDPGDDDEAGDVVR